MSYPALYFFQLEYFFFMEWVPDWGSILQLWADQCVIGSLTFSFLVLILRWIKFSVLVAVPVIRSMWVFQERPLEISTPKYFAHVTTSKIWPAGQKCKLC